MNINEAHGSSLYNMDDSIRDMYSYTLDCLDKKSVVDEQKSIFEEFIFDKEYIFYVNVYNIKFNAYKFIKNENFKNVFINISVHDIIDDEFDYNKHNNILDVYDAYVNYDTNIIDIKLYSYNLEIKPATFFTASVHELQHLFTKFAHKNDMDKYFTMLSNEIQSYVTKTFSHNEVIVINELFYKLFDFTEVSSYSSEIYGELLTLAKNRNITINRFTDVINNTYSYNDLKNLEHYLDLFKRISEKRIFKICKFIFEYNVKNNINNNFSKNIEQIFNDNNEMRFKKYLIKKFENALKKMNDIIIKIASNYFICEKKYAFNTYNSNGNFTISDKYAYQQLRESRRIEYKKNYDIKRRKY